ncbi:glycosyltransferase family 2 protein [Halosquirtibacter xylanolyticus]|uniref:glycosyltransferase n=1 Tax=Halosquirtibacter xylanolyticus TaxID=3374599 RepID=UPI0037495F21|nr:glycosyltransferase family 2 protein [Prolixibacteraceae bacterium]
MPLNHEFFSSLFPRFNFAELTILEIIILSIILFYFVFYIITDFRHLLFYRKRTTASGDYQKSVSIILSTKNEFDVLQPVLESLLKQDYHDFEVVVVDDCSEDRTPIALQKMSLEYPQLVFTRIFNETEFNNALTLSVGTRAASKEWLLFLTPNMRPVKKDYLKTLMAGVKEDDILVQGLCNYEPVKSWSNYFLRLHIIKYGIDHFSNSQINGLVPALPYNIAYKRHHFTDTKGFRAFLDERFYINEWYAHSLTQTSKQLAIVMDPRAKVLLNDPYDKCDYLNQREKYLLMKKRYGFGQKVMQWLKNWGWPVSFISLLLLIVCSKYRVWGLLLFSLGSLIHMLITRWITKKIQEKNFVLFEYISRLFWPFYSFNFWLKFRIQRQRRRWS